MKKFSVIFTSLTLLSSVGFAEALNYEITAKKLDDSRANISPKTGGSSFVYRKEDIKNLPQGQASSLNQILLRAPSVAQDSYRQVHIRGDHSNVQYRINDVIIPEGINGFGQVLDAGRFGDSINLITGALPAQYGYRTAGVVEIKTKDRASENGLDNGAYSELITGANQTFGVNQQVSGKKNGFNYFISGSYLQNDRGLESPTKARKSIHNETKQDKVFGYFSYLLDAKKRLSLIFANSTNRFQIPTIPNQDSAFNLNGSLATNSGAIDNNQKENNRFAVVSLQGVNDNDVDYQISGFARQSTLNFRGDYERDLIFSGVSSSFNKSSFVVGSQGDFSKDLNDKNTLRTGFYFSDTAVKNSQKNWLFPATLNSQNQMEQSSDVPFAVNQYSTKHSQLYSIYAQNEYKPFEKLKLNIGGRYDKAQVARSESQFSPRAGAVYEFNKKTKMHAGYARYFTAPKAELISNLNINDFANTTNAPSNFDNSPVRSERSNYYDIGIGHQFSESLHFGFDSYYKQSKNLLDEGQFGNALIFKPFNYDRAKTYGAEFTADYKNNNFSSYANLALQKSQARKIVSSQYLHDSEELEYVAQNYVYTDHSQKITASSGMAYKFLKTKTNIGGDVIFGSGLRRGDYNKNSMPSYAQLNLFAMQEVAKFNFRLAINNILDQKYRLRDGTGIGVQASQYSPRRSVFLIASREW